MKTRVFILSLVALCFVNSSSFADRQLDRPEIGHILQALTAEPHKTWIPAGTIVASHEEYKAVVKDTNGRAAANKSSSGYKMTTNVIVRYSGEKFYWQIDTVSRTNLTSSDANTSDTAEFDSNANKSRIFVWDGRQYSTYFRLANSAVIKDAAKNKIAPIVNGPLTAGFIPWGYGYYTYEKLSASAIVGIENVTDGLRQIQLTLNHPNGSEMVFVLDPEKNYAVLSHSVKKPNGATAVNTYGNFLLTAGRWIPTTIMIDQYTYFVAEQNLIASDLWNFTSVNSGMPAEDSYKVDYSPDTLVEYHNAITNKSVLYRYSKAEPASKHIDTDSLLIDKFALDAAGSGQPQNCATAAMKYVASKLGKNVADRQLSQLMQDHGANTSLYALKQFAQGIGLYCRAVRTDLQTLKNLTGYQAILHLPGKNHYVVLGNIDDKYVRTIDLSSRKFFDRLSVDDFGLEWTDGTALLVSNEPINARLTDIDDAALKTIVGTGYTCTKLIQEYELFFCSGQIGGDCGGTYQEYDERWGCELDTLALFSTCGMSMMEKYQELPCIVNPYDPTTCTVTGDWIVHYMRACQ